MKKSCGSSQKLGSFLSPGAPNMGNQKGWSSERVTSQASNIRHGSVANLTPFNSGRTIPSKWDDAERWICSPVSGYDIPNNNKTNSYSQFQRRPKSKSGPIVAPGTGYYSTYSPTIPLRQGLVLKNMMMMGGSPFSTGVLAPDAISLHHYYAHEHEHDAAFGPRYDFDYENGETLPSVSSAPMWSELLCQPSSPNSQDEKGNETKNEDAVTSPLTRCDTGTQMTPPETENDATNSSPTSSTMDQQNSHSAKLEVRDVEIDSEATIIRWSKSHLPRLSLLPGEHSRKSSRTETKASGLNIADSTLDSSKIQREEAKIVVWESLQKARAEAAIRKLEMKLEKKKSSSMDKILNKLRRAQMRAEKMRNQISVKEGQQVSKARKLSSFDKYAQIWSPRNCFGGAHAP